VLLVHILILAVLVLIFVQDIKSRSVYWVVFPFLVVLFIVLRLLEHQSFAAIWQPTLINVLFLFVQIAILTAYFSVKRKQFVLITTGLLGLGDILFLLAVACYLSVLNFLMFYLVSMVVSLLVWIVWQAINKQKEKQIPLAGYQAILFTLLLVFNWWIIPLHITNDDWPLQLLKPWM
jgi:Flp pilus assembly protein protease CpaA